MALVVALLACGCSVQDTGPLYSEQPATPSIVPEASNNSPLLPAAPRTARAAQVVHVSDGDTIVLKGIGVGEIHASTGGYKARLIGVDTPETYGQTECFGAAASAFTKRELDDTTVLVDFDVDRTDRFDRALVYVWQDDGRFFNARLVQEGYALQSTFPPNVRYVELFSRLVTEARKNNRGLWTKCA